MRRFWIVPAFGLLLACSDPTPPRIPTPMTPPSSPIAAVCQDMSHVYNPNRLTVLKPCVSVDGIVEIIRVEADGDYHILVHVDPGQVDPNGGLWVNTANTTYQHGDLVTEPVCEHTVTQADAVSACVGYKNPALVPRVGDHVRVSGPWVLDTTHFSWAEIHPATYTELPALAIIESD